MNRSLFFRIMGLILVLFVFLGAENKKKPKKAWFPLGLAEIGLSKDQVKKIEALDCYKKLNSIRNGIKKKNISISSKEARKIKDDNKWKDQIKKLKAECKKILTSDQKKKQKENEAQKKKKPKK